MKKQVLTMSLLALTAMPASAAINCAVLPTCEELGYNNKTADCDSSNVLKCPFDQTKGKCLSAGGFVGQISYFAKDPGDGWLLCDGRLYHKNQYPELYAKIGTMYGGGGDIFMVPPYAGEGLLDQFLRPATSTSTYLTKGCVPNVTATGIPWESWKLDESNGKKNRISGALYLNTSAGKTWLGSGDSDDNNYTLDFDASKSNPLYSSGCYSPTPHHYDVAIYIYAGKVGTSSTTAKTLSDSCKVGDYYYTDGTCSTSKNTSKTMRGKVSYVSIYSKYNTIKYVWGGSSSNTGIGAEVDCRSKASRGHIAGQYDMKDAKISTSYDGVLSPLTTGRRYWSSYSISYTCSTTDFSNCTSSYSSDANNSPTSYNYYYCYAYDYLY